MKLKEQTFRSSTCLSRIPRGKVGKQYYKMAIGRPLERRAALHSILEKVVKKMGLWIGSQ